MYSTIKEFVQFWNYTVLLKFPTISGLPSVVEVPSIEGFICNWKL